MSEIELVILGQDEQREITLIPKGMTIGRGENCDIVLNGKMVSRLHARIFQDSFGRWIIEDMGSKHGVYVDEQKVKTHVVKSNEEISIGSFLLTLWEAADRALISSKYARAAIRIKDEGDGEHFVSFKDEEVPGLSPGLMWHLNDFKSGLLELSSPSDLYSEACLRLSRMLDTFVAIVRVPDIPRPIPEKPDILVCYWGGTETETKLTLSRRVLDAVRTNDTLVMTSSWPPSSGNAELVDVQRPHFVLGARVNDMDENIDLLYLDIDELKSPAEMFCFIEAVVRQIDIAQKKLFCMELYKKEQELRESNAQLKENDRIMDEYISRVTHDIKGHLSAIQSCLFVASSEKSGPLTEKQADFLNRAVKRNEKLTSFVKELLGLTLVKLCGQLDRNEFSLPDSIAGVFETVGRKAEDKSITLTYKVDSAVRNMTGNEFSIKEMMTNLLFNAIKYTPEGRTVHLEATVQDDSIRLDFSDTGIGIPEGEIEYVFDEFFRGTNAKENVSDGTGLGLSIVKQIVERHGGDISVESREGKGSIFTVIVPVSW
ncbi:MAG: FHA domain-containing protein [Candidatus Krumholzibacteria bacterium]|nr:FHA domain-containing protein [Candidatus Krumholzibacteria bacterium]